MPEIITPAQATNLKHLWHLYIIQVNLDLLDIKRNEFIQKLSDNNISSSVNFIALHLHPFYRNNFIFYGEFLNAEKAYECIISLPIYPAMSSEEVQL